MAGLLIVHVSDADSEEYEMYLATSQGYANKTMELVNQVAFERGINVSIELLPITDTSLESMHAFADRCPHALERLSMKQPLMQIVDGVDLGSQSFPNCLFPPDSAAKL